MFFYLFPRHTKSILYRLSPVVECMQVFIFVCYVGCEGT